MGWKVEPEIVSSAYSTARLHSAAARSNEDGEGAIVPLGQDDLPLKGPVPQASNKPYSPFYRWDYTIRKRKWYPPSFPGALHFSVCCQMTRKGHSGGEGCHRQALFQGTFSGPLLASAPCAFDCRRARRKQSTVQGPRGISFRFWSQDYAHILLGNCVS